MDRRQALTRSLAATAGTLAAASSSDAALVRITLNYNYISFINYSLEDSIRADLTGDGNNDIFINNFPRIFSSTGIYGIHAFINTSSTFNRIYAAKTLGGYFKVDAQFEFSGIGTPNNNGTNSPVTAFYYNAITFTDSRINANALTNAFLLVQATSGSTGPRIELSAVYFDDEDPNLLLENFNAANAANATEWSAVPELSNGLTALALGAAGILRRRRQARAC